MKRLIIAGMAVCLWMSCKGPTATEGCTPIGSDNALEWVVPIGGTYAVGTTVGLGWKVKPAVVDQVTLQVSTSGTSGPWRNIFSKGIAVPAGGDVACMDTTWVVGNEYDKITYSSSGTVLLRVGWYNHETQENAVSPLLTVNP